MGYIIEIVGRTEKEVNEFIQLSNKLNKPFNIKEINSLKYQFIYKRICNCEKLLIDLHKYFIVNKLWNETKDDYAFESYIKHKTTKATIQYK